MQTQHRARISMANATPAAQHIVGQYYQFLRMGHAGYLRVLHGCATVAAHLADGIAATGAFTILSVRTPPPASPTRSYAADSCADKHTAHSFMLSCVHQKLRLPGSIETIILYFVTCPKGHWRQLRQAAEAADGTPAGAGVSVAPGLGSASPRPCANSARSGRRLAEPGRARAAARAGAGRAAGRLRAQAREAGPWLY